MAIVSSLRRSLKFKARWSNRLERRLHYNDRVLVQASPVTPVLSFSFSPPLPIFFQWMPTQFENLLLHSLWVGKYRGIFSSLFIGPPCSRANTATLELNIPLYCPPSHAIRPNKLNSQFIVTTQSSNFHEGGRSLFIVHY